jgi:hypothetical protein
MQDKARFFGASSEAVAKLLLLMGHGFGKM